MNDNIGVALIVGLTTGTSLYIWNSESFTKTQKIVLLLFIIFPPLQWISILLVLVYNKYQSENTIEAKTIKQDVEDKQNLDSAKSNLINLKEKGIITEEEFNTKVEKIEIQKIEYDIKDSIEYKQLKSLLDRDILTKEEFDSKIDLIKNTPIKKVNIEELERLQNYVDNIKLPLKEDSKKESSNYIYVYLILFFVVIVSVVLTISHFNENNAAQSYDSPPAIAEDTTALNNYNYQESIKNKKFVYIVMKVEKPNLDVFQPMSYINSVGLYEIPDPIYSINYEKETYSTEITEIENYNLDEKYKAMDNAKNKMYSQLEMYDSSNYINTSNKCKDEAKREEFKKISSKIVDTQIYEFDSYSEASIHKEEIGKSN